MRYFIHYFLNGSGYRATIDAETPEQARDNFRSRFTAGEVPLAWSSVTESQGLSRSQLRAQALRYRSFAPAQADNDAMLKRDQQGMKNVKPFLKSIVEPKKEVKIHPAGLFLTTPDRQLTSHQVDPRWSTAAMKD
jgi:hypothetical protein